MIYYIVDVFFRGKVSYGKSHRAMDHLYRDSKSCKNAVSYTHLGLAMGIDNLKKQDNKKNVIVSVLKVLLLVAIVVGIPLYIYFFQKDWLSQFRNFDDIISYLQGYKLESIPIYIGIQVLQIVISVIPGQFFNLAAGYLYTFFPALLDVYKRQVHVQVIENVIKYTIKNGLRPAGLTYSPVTGAKGNIEFLLYIDGKLKQDEIFDDEILDIREIVNTSHEELE